MNQKTSKLLRRHRAENYPDKTDRDIKRAWNATPRNLRGRMRAEVLKLLK